MYLPYVILRLSTHGIVYNHNKEKVVYCYVHASFYGGWSQADADNTENFMSIQDM